MAKDKIKKLDRKATVRIATARNDITIPYYSTVLAPVDAGQSHEFYP